MEMQVSDAIATLLEQIFPKFTIGKLVYIHLDSRLNYYGTDDSEDEIQEDEIQEESCSIHFLFQRRTNYTQVAYCVNHEWKFPDLKDFKYGSDHDSCWISSGVHSTIAREYFRMADAINSRLKKRVAPITMSTFNYFRQVKILNGSMKTVRPEGKGPYCFKIELTEES